MKISELPKITSVRPDIEIPLAVQEENYSITLGQIMEALGANSSGGGVVPFDKVNDTTTDVYYADGEPPAMIGDVVFDKNTGKFYYAVERVVGDITSGSTILTYYSEWPTRDKYYDDDAIRKDVLFLDSDGRLYAFSGTSLKSVGLTDELKDALEKKAGVFYKDTDNSRYLVFASADTRNEYLVDPTKEELILATIDSPDAALDEITKLKAEMVMAIELDEDTGQLALLYSEDNTTIADAAINDRGEIEITVNI